MMTRPDEDTPETDTHADALRAAQRRAHLRRLDASTADAAVTSLREALEDADTPPSQPPGEAENRDP
ncbi:hypothetical protein [Streptomyces sp. t39]|uniref:hypothetical protein n=1 Tax=Streptomyces sp. t39 TaxID=1828156 RepID=UPI0011CEC806|nr:hypothetical protein [Streptomyces sp. t39]TXS42017.1 hypothetical protein EAO77_35610 [Streptomyces sp. t39]